MTWPAPPEVLAVPIIQIQAAGREKHHVAIRPRGVPADGKSPGIPINPAALDLQAELSRALRCGRRHYPRIGIWEVIGSDRLTEVEPEWPFCFLGFAEARAYAEFDLDPFAHAARAGATR